MAKVRQAVGPRPCSHGHSTLRLRDSRQLSLGGVEVDVLFLGVILLYGSHRPVKEATLPEQNGLPAESVDQPGGAHVDGCAYQACK
jgi:hypothetical protein